ncbi:polysaccharide lyase family 8 super-sandwich domain-containing protein [Kitasatospora paranensis]|uniref:Polysaccharide lyase family 8 super-sandwich domain-containing protein n=1 Tax=Kitasatospora paranensis TaxID=258053 RepID=A0ABW2G3B9_9ACTN
MNDVPHPRPARIAARPLTRRRLLLAAAATALATGTDWTAAAAGAHAAADPYATLADRWRQLLVGTGYDPAAEPFVTALATTADQAAGYRAAMTPAAASLWPDLPLGSVSANVTGSLTRLRTMALAYAQPGTSLTGDTGLAAAVATGLDHLTTHAYTPATTGYGNWWDWQIGAPEALLDVCVLMAGQLDAALLATCCAAVDHFVPDSAVASYTGTSTGANRVDLCRVIGLRGVVGRDSAKITTASAALGPVFPYVRYGDGLYADGSFVQHSYLPYTGSYGAVLLDGLSRMLWLLADSAWAVDPAAAQNLFDSVATAWAPFLYNGLVMDGVSGRAISRGVQLADPLKLQGDDHRRGHAVIGDILRLANSGVAPAAQAAAWRAAAKGWLQRDLYSPYLADRTVAVPELARAQALLADTAVTATAEPAGHRIFAMDRAVHRRAGWAASVSMCSARTTFYENGNGENVRGWHTNNGMTYWWGAGFGNGQYSDAFWPTVDPYRLPGTTVSTKRLADGAGGTWGAARPDAVWAGGATDGSIAAVGQDLRGLTSTLTGRKSWFFLDDSVLCLGAGITCTDGVPVETVLDNRNLGATGTHALTVDGTVQPSTLGWTQQFSGARAFALAGFGACVVPAGAQVHALREARTGAWSDINAGGDTAAITRRYLTLWLDHGTDPGGASYEYLLMPGADAATAAARAAAPRAVVLANTATVQAVTDSASGTTAANFFAAGTAGPITVDGPCSVLLREQSGTLTVCVADPSRTAATVRVTIARTGCASAQSDPGLTVLGVSGAVTLLAETGGTQGASLRATLTADAAHPVSPGTARALAPTADSYVRDGSYAGTNYGSDTTLTVKNDATGYARIALLGFDPSALPAVRRAVLWVHGAVADSGGVQTSLQACAVDGTWTETAVTWANRPALGAALGTGQATARADWTGLDVTSAVAAAAAAGTPGFALALWQPAKGLAVVLSSRQAGSFQPFLEVVTD